jgi:site-specific recombinase XerC
MSDPKFPHRSKATQASYLPYWKAFEAWCEEHGLKSRPASPGTIQDYLTSTRFREHWPAIQLALSEFGYPIDWNDVRKIREIVRTIREAQGPAKPTRWATAQELDEMVRAVDGTHNAVRDKAMLLLTRAGNFRRTQLVGLDRKDVRLFHDRAEITIPRTIRGDRRSEGGIGSEARRIPPRIGEQCPVAALEAWLKQGDHGRLGVPFAARRSPNRQDRR